jgi:hypothetical protein
VPDHAVLFDAQVVVDREAMICWHLARERTVRTSSTAVPLVELPGA